MLLSSNTLPSAAPRIVENRDAILADLRVSPNIDGFRCMSGTGEILRSMSAVALVQSAEEAAERLNPRYLGTQIGRVLISRDAPMPHPLEVNRAAENEGGLGHGSLSRSFIDGRSFHWLDASISRNDSIVVKGDLNPRGAQALGGNIGDRVIPGGCDIRESITEFDAARAIRRLRDESPFGWLQLPTPLQVVRIQHVETDSGLLTIRQFLNSPYYAANASALGQKNAAQLLLDGQGAQPAQYWYRVPGSCVRVSELVEVLVFNDGVPFYQGNLIINPRGEALRRSDMDRADIFRSAYSLLGQQYGIDLTGASTTVDFTDDRPTAEIFRDIHDALGQLPSPDSRVANSAPDYIFQRFVSRLTAITALAHATTHTFTNQAISSRGSLTPRNVTLAGMPLDYNTFRSQEGIHPEAVRADFQDLLVATAFMRRLVAANAPSSLAGEVHSMYLAYARQVNPGIERTLARITSPRAMPYELIQSL